ncbi:MAG: helix-turn-helix domain-containing protein [Promethearchaeota archaeon]
MEKLQITRSSPDHDELVELYKKEKNSKLKERYHALFLMHEFMNCTTVAELTKRSRRAIQNWVKIFNQGGLETIAPNLPPGRPSNLSKEQKESLKDDVLTHPRELGYDFSNWEGKSVAYHIKQRFSVELGVRQAQRLLHEIGFTLQRPRYAFPKADPEKKKEFLNDFKKVWMVSEKMA